MSLGLDGSSEGSRGEFVRFWAEQGEEPAFVRRAREVEAGWTDLLRRCELQRVEMLRWARMRLAEIARLVGVEWRGVGDLLADGEQAVRLAALYEEWKRLMPGYVTGEARASTGIASGTQSIGSGIRGIGSGIRGIGSGTRGIASSTPSVARSSSPWTSLRTALLAYAETAERFNAAWEKFLSEVDLTAINRQRADFNVYYPIEKAAAFETQDVSRLGFVPMVPATIDDLSAVFPLLEVPAIQP